MWRGSIRFGLGLLLSADCYCEQHCVTSRRVMDHLFSSARLQDMEKDGTRNESEILFSVNIGERKKEVG